jgi:hypothetical protein
MVRVVAHMGLSIFKQFREKGHARESCRRPNSDVLAREHERVGSVESLAPRSAFSPVVRRGFFLERTPWSRLSVPAPSECLHGRLPCCLISP